ncbi:hypothetical protein GWG67_38025 [Bradyrhizobium sp. CSS354]|nr:hypothetical protein [Bradyrhizobium sp. CSS354]
MAAGLLRTKLAHRSRIEHLLSQNLLWFAFSSCNSLNSFASETSIPPSLAFQLSIVAVGISCACEPSRPSLPCRHALHHADNLLFSEPFSPIFPTFSRSVASKLDHFLLEFSLPNPLGWEKLT